MQTEFQYKHVYNMGFQDKRKIETSSNSLQSMTKLLSLQSESSYAYKTWHRILHKIVGTWRGDVMRKG